MIPQSSAASVWHTSNPRPAVLDGGVYIEGGRLTRPKASPPSRISESIWKQNPIGVQGHNEPLACDGHGPEHCGSRPLFF